MKRILCILIALTLVFGSILPVFAASESIVTSFANPSLSNQVSAYQVMTSIVSYLANISAAFTYDQNGNSPIDNISNSLAHLEGWLVPDGSRTSSDYTLWEIVTDIGTNLYTYLPYIPNISTYIASWMSNNNTYLSKQVEALTNINPGGHSMTIGEIQRNAHRSFVSELSEYSIDFFNKATGVVSSNTYNWQAGSPLGNIALILQKLNQNTVNIAETFLKNYNDTLTTWEHSTNTQTSFTPISLSNGLYRYLAYIQSDTSSLWYYGLFNSLKSSIYTYNLSTGTGSLYSASSLGDALVTMLSNQSNMISRTQYIFDRLYPSESTNSPYNRAWNPENLESVILNTNYRGIQKWLPMYLGSQSFSLARLAFVHADDNDIAAKRGTQSNEQTITNNFLSTSGTAAASASDYGALASASGSFKQNFNTGASASGIFDLFNGDHASSWFSQETANQLDSNNAVRSVKGGARTVTVLEYDTPLLDSYYSDIMSIFNKKSDDYSEYVNYIDESIYPAQGVQEEGVIID